MAIGRKGILLWLVDVKEEPFPKKRRKIGTTGQLGLGDVHLGVRTTVDPQYSPAGRVTRVLLLGNRDTVAYWWWGSDPNKISSKACQTQLSYRDFVPCNELRHLPLQQPSRLKLWLFKTNSPCLVLVLILVVSEKVFSKLRFYTHTRAVRIGRQTLHSQSLTFRPDLQAAISS